MSDSPARPIAVIGAGWAGLSAAAELCRMGHRITLIDAAPRAGGRARQIEVGLADRRVVLDNGQHLLIGAYSASLALIHAAQVGLAGSGAAHAGKSPASDGKSMPDGLIRVPLQFDSRSLTLRQSGPGRLGLMIGFLRARGLDWRSRARMMTFTMGLATRRWRGFEGLSVTRLLGEFNQTQQAVEQFWGPLCIAAMNTHPDQACAQTFVNILHDSMFGAAGGSDFLIPTDDLGSLMPEPMVTALRAAGSEVSLGVATRSLARDGSRWRVSTTRGESAFDQVILATPVWQTARLLAPILPAGADLLERFEQEAIQTVFLAWPESAQVTLPTLKMLDEDPALGHYGQWLFARRPQQGLSIAAVVISVRARLDGLDNATLAKLVCDQVCRTLALPEPLDALAVNEKRATFRCTPDRPRVEAAHIGPHALPDGLALAGEYCYARYPGTLESAVRSGIAAARRSVVQTGSRIA